MLSSTRGILIALVLTACNSKSETPKEAELPPAPAAHAESSYQDKGSSQCQACHSAITKEWSASMHGNSTLAKDPLFKLMFTKAKAVVGDKVEKGCRKCHNPMWEPDVDEQRASAEGVTCVVCHQVAPTHPVDTLPTGEVALLDPIRAPEGATQALCLSCHAERKTGKGVPICITGSENEHAGSAKCVDCHMASTPGPGSTGSKNSSHRSHTFPGGHVAAWVAEAASLELRLDKEKAELVATIKPGALGHSLPTGNPMRHIILDVVAKDAKGSVVWRNRPEGEPLLKERDSVFMRAFKSAEGKSPVPPFASSGEPSDNRLQNATPHELRYPLPKGATQVTATLIYRLAPAAVLEEAQAPAHWKQPVEMGRAELSLP
jgi:hypothetical protein